MEPGQSWILDSTSWISDSSYLDSGIPSLGDSGFLELYSGFQSPGFRIPLEKISRIPDSTNKNFENPDSLHAVKRKSLFSIFGKQIILTMLSLTLAKRKVI